MKRLIVLFCFILISVSQLFSVYAQIGSGTDVIGTTSVTPFGTYYEDGQNQILYTADELIAVGLPAGEISSIGFHVDTAASQTMNGFNVELKHTTATYVNGWESGFTNCYSGTWIAVTGWNDINLTTNFIWDGVSNLLVKVCFHNTSYTTNSYIYYHLATDMNGYSYNDNTNGCSDPYQGVEDKRPHTRFEYTEIVPTADFSADQTNGFAPFIVNFTDNSAGNPTQWEWDVDNDGTVDYSTQDCSHTYANLGSYSVKLNVTNIAGSDELIKTDYITVSNPPNIATLPEEYDVYVVQGDTLSENLMIYNYGEGNLEWNIEQKVNSFDETSYLNYYATGDSTVHNFNTGVVNYDAVLTITMNGDYNDSSEYATTYIEGTNLGIIPDGDPANGTDITYIYNLNAADMASWTSDGTLSVTIDNNSSVHTNQGGSNSHQVQLTCDDEGEYYTIPANGTTAPFSDDVIELVFDARNTETGSFSGDVTINSNDPDEPEINIPYTMNVGNVPIADFTQSETSGFSPLNIDFTDISTGNPTSWQWDIDNDGTTDYTTQNCSHSYVILGTYSVKLTVQNSWGTDEILMTDLITVEEPPDIAVSPTEFLVNVATGSTEDKTLTIYNNNIGTLDWEIGSSTSESNPKVLLLHTTDDATIFKNAMVNTGLFLASDIDILTNPNYLIDLSTLSPYDVVLAWTNDSFINPQNIGDTLKEFVDTGGGVIIATYSLSSSWEILGGISDSGYCPFIPSSTQSVSGTINYSSLSNPTHPVFEGISSDMIYWFNSSYSNPSLNTGGSMLAYDSLGNRVIAENQNGNVMGIVIYPENIDSGNEAAQRMFANALHYVSRDEFTSAFPENGSIVTSGFEETTITFDATDLSDGTYYETIQVTSNDPDEPIIDIPVTMIVSSSSPLADFSADNTNGGNPFTVNFTDTSTNNPASWQWDIDNNGTVDYTTQNCTHTYTQISSFSIKLSVSNIFGSDEELKADYILVSNGAPYVENPISDFNFDEDTIDSSIDLNFVFEDGDGDNLSFSYSGNSHISVDIVDGLVTLTPAENWNGNEDIVFTATEVVRSNKSRKNNVSRASFSDTVNVLINPINDAPEVINPMVQIEITKNGNHITPNLNTIFSDVDFQLLLTSFSIQNDNHISYVINADTTVTLTPDTDWIGGEVLHFKATGDQGISTIDYVDVVVYDQVIYTENFDHNGNAPVDWNATEWDVILDSGDDYSMKAETLFMQPSNDKLVSEVFDFTFSKNIEVSFDSEYSHASSQAIFEISTNNGYLWTNIVTLSATATETLTYDVSAYADQENTVQFRWHFISGNNPSSWEIDDFNINYDALDSDPPSTISDLSITSSTATSITLNWTSPTENYFANYEIYYSLDSDVTTADSLWNYLNDVNLTAKSTNSTIITDLNTDQEYWIKIRSLNNSGANSEFSNSANVVCVLLPVSHSPYPNQGNLPYSNSRTVDIGITFTDDTMLNASSIQYRIDSNGNGTYDGSEIWADVSHTRYTNSDSIEVLETVTYTSDGENLYFEFRVQDTIGTEYAYTGTSQTEGISDDYYVQIDTEAPTVISDLMADGVSSTSTLLSWSIVTEPHFEEYKIYYNTHENIDQTDLLWNSIDDSDLSNINTTSTIVSGLTHGEIYWFKVCGIDTFDNESTLSNEVASISNNIPPECTNPFPIDQPDPEFYNTMTVTIGCDFIDYYGINESTVQYRIDANGNGVYDTEEIWQDYLLVREIRSNFNKKKMLNKNFRDSAVFDTLEIRKNVTYDIEGDDLSFEFRAYDVDGYGPTYSGLSSLLGISDDWKVKIDTTAPVAIDPFGVGATTEATIEVGWGVSEDIHFAGYELYYSEIPGVTISDNLWDKNDDPALANIGTEYAITIVTGLDPSTTYYFRVRAIDEAGNSCELTSEVSGTTESIYLPLSPQNVTITTSGEDVILNWDEVTENTNGDPITVSEYKIYSSNDPYWGEGAQTEDYTSVTNSFTHTGVLTALDVIFYRISAVTSTSKNSNNNLIRLLNEQKKDNRKRK
ncbi:MAG: fibronectin type III domain-containing protein [Candidatus Cloacimonetes bacterium]|nr:fibronectin type III domain-containing protein [Candidatus Cloacimonadota bacterium]